MANGQAIFVPSIERLRDTNAVLKMEKRGLPYPGSRPENGEFFPQLKTIHDAYMMGNEVYSQSWVIPPEMKAYNTGNGSPLFHKAFYPAVAEACSVLHSEEVSQYAFAAGDLNCRRRVADYLFREGIRTDTVDGRINENQVIFFNSTTEAFSLLMKVICRPGDVVLFAAPTYGLLAYAPERVGAETKFVRMRAEDDWLINPQILEETIVRENRRLNLAHNQFGYNPCVTAFVSINPNNPTGRVMGRSRIQTLERMSEVCKENGVFLVDDIIYRDLCYDAADPAIPVASIEGAFPNTITLFGTSKCFGLAGARAGAILADECVIRGLRNELFQLMDSTPLTVSYLMAGAFNTSEARDQYYREYFTPILRYYEQNWRILKTIIEGMDEAHALDDNDEQLIRNVFEDKVEAILKNGISMLSIAGAIHPESGFFALVDFTALLGCMDKTTGQLLQTEMDILFYFYRSVNIKLLTGDSFAWPVNGQVVARVSFAYEKEDLIKMLYQLYLGVEALLEE